MSNIKTIYPSQIFEAVEHAKKTNPSDTRGDSAFKIDYANLKSAGNDTRYIPFLVNIKEGDKRVWTNVVLKYTGLSTKAKILRPDDPKRNEKIKSMSLQFRRSSCYNRKVKLNNKEIIIEEKYGEAKMIIYGAFKRLATEGIKSGAIRNIKRDIIIAIQTSVLTDVKQRTTKAIEDPIIRVEIQFIKEKGANIPKNDAPPKCEIYDIMKRLPPSDPRVIANNGFVYEIATIDRDNDVKESLTYCNIGEFITPGSVVSGIDSMSDVCLSASGISLPSRATLIIVKKSRGFKPDPSAIFNSDELCDNEKAEAAYTEDSEINDAYMAANTTEVSSTLVDDLSASTNIDEIPDENDVFA
jgi:hypothetical protein